MSPSPTYLAGALYYFNDMLDSHNFIYVDMYADYAYVLHSKGENVPFVPCFGHLHVCLIM